MNERKNPGDRSPQRRPVEGVRIIRADEAQAALEAGEASGRRPDDELRYGDVPPAPVGPRPAHRFPLPDSMDPAGAVPLPPLAASSGTGEGDDVTWSESLDLVGPATWGDQPAAEPAGEDEARDDWGIGEPTAEFVIPAGAGYAVSRPTSAMGGGWAGGGGWEPAGTAAGGAAGSAGSAASAGSGASAALAASAGSAGTGATPGWSETAGTGGSGAHASAGRSGSTGGSDWTGGQPDDQEPARPGGPPPASPSPSVEPSALAPPEEGITVTGGGTELPHWTDPPTGEVPLILPDDGRDEEGEDDLDAWKALGARGMRWRDDSEDWADVEEISELGSEEAALGALDQTRSEHSDLYSFDEEFERVEAARTGAAPTLADFEELEPDPADPRARAAAATSSRARARTGAHGPAGRPPGRPGVPAQNQTGDDDLGTRVVVGIGLVVLLIIAYLVGPKALVVLSAAIVVAAAAEAYGMLQRSGFRPATLLGLVAALGLVFGAYWKGIETLPLAVVLVFAGSMTWYLLRIVEARPLANVAVTTMAFVWVALLGSYSAVMLRAHHGKGLLLGAVVVGVAADIGGFVVGRWLGSRPIAPTVSPSKTVEGFIGGLVAALIVGAIIGKEVTPWGGIRHGLVLGLIVGLVAPAGDLFESMIKRDLGIKDSGSSLPGHGGLLDRFDSLLLVLPAAYYFATLINIVK